MIICARRTGRAVIITTMIICARRTGRATRLRRRGGRRSITRASRHMRVERGDLLWGKRSPLAQRQITEEQIALTNADQPTHLIAKEPGDLADLTLAALAQHNTKPRPLVSRLDQIDPGRRGRLTVKDHTLAPLAHGLRVERLIEERAILLLHLVARVGELVGQLAIIGKQQETLAIDIKPAHGIDAGGDIDQIDHCRATLGVIHRRDHANGLIQHQVGAGRRLTDGLAINLNHILTEIHPGTGLLNHTAIHRHATGGNHAFTVATRRDARTSEHLLQAFSTQNNTFLGPLWGGTLAWPRATAPALASAQ